MTIKVGNKLPDATLMQMTGEGPTPRTIKQIFDGRKVALFSVPGAFTPTCSAKHLPGFVEQSDKFKTSGFDEVICMAVNDAFVMGAWGKAQNADGKVSMLADGNGDFSTALGLEMDGRAYGMGMRGQRFSMIVEDGTVTTLNVEGPGEFHISSADHMLTQL